MKYGYIIYKIYSWTKYKKNDTPITNTCLTLAAVHFFQIATLLVIVDRSIFHLSFIFNINKIFVFLFALTCPAVFQLIVYNKDRWNRYVEEYSCESEENRIKGNVKVVSFVVGSIVLFFVSVIVLYGLLKK